jgi:hypothetical protein
MYGARKSGKVPLYYAIKGTECITIVIVNFEHQTSEHIYV